MITLNQKRSKIVLVNNLIEPSMTSKKSDTKIMNFSTVFRPLHYFSRIWGLAPFSIVTNSNGDVQEPKVHLCDSLWFLIMLCMYLSFANYTLEVFANTRGNYNEKSWIMSVCAILMVGLTFIHGILAIIINVCNRYKLVDMVKMFTRFDKEVLIVTLDFAQMISLSFRFFFVSFHSLKVIKLKIYFNYGHDYRLNKLICIVSMMIILAFPLSLLLIRTEYGENDTDTTYSLFQYLNVFCFISFQISPNIIPTLMYVIFLHHLYKRYKALNSLLRYQNIAPSKLSQGTKKEF